MTYNSVHRRDYNATELAFTVAAGTYVTRNYSEHSSFCAQGVVEAAAGAAWPSFPPAAQVPGAGQLQVFKSWGSSLCKPASCF